MTTAGLYFDHVHIISRDPRAAAQWFVEKLDGRVVAETEARGALQVAVAFEGATVLIRGARTGEAPDTQSGQYYGTDHFGFGVRGDFDGYCNTLKAKGVVFTLDPMDFGPDLRIAFIQAPGGVSIELLQRRK